jgi:hypothetical protein
MPLPMALTGQAPTPRMASAWDKTPKPADALVLALVDYGVCPGL